MLLTACASCISFAHSRVRRLQNTYISSMRHCVCRSIHTSCGGEVVRLGTWLSVTAPIELSPASRQIPSGGLRTAVLPVLLRPQRARCVFALTKGCIRQLFRQLAKLHLQQPAAASAARTTIQSNQSDYGGRLCWTCCALQFNAAYRESPRKVQHGQ